MKLTPWAASLTDEQVADIQRALERIAYELSPGPVEPTNKPQAAREANDVSVPVVR